MMSLEGSVQFIDLEGGCDDGNDDVLESDLEAEGDISSEVNIKDLTIKLLTSPENLDFALQHQADKVLDLQGKVSQLLSLNTLCVNTQLQRAEEPFQHLIRAPASDRCDNSADKDQAVTDHQDQMVLSNNTSTYAPRSRKLKSACRAKNRPRPRYVQLPPTFKYPEPIDIRPARGYTPSSEIRKEVTTQHNSPLVRPVQHVQVPSLNTTLPGPHTPVTTHPNTGYDSVSAARQGALPQVSLGVGPGDEAAVHVSNPLELQNVSRTLAFREGENQNKPTNHYQHANKGIFQSDANNFKTDLSLSQKLCLSLPQTINDSHLMTAKSAAKSMFEIVVGDMKELDTKITDRVFWENRGLNLAHLPDTTVPRPPHKRVCPKHAGHGNGNRFQCACPGSRAAKPWGHVKSSPVGARFPSPFMHWKNAIELSRARRCRTKIEPDMLDLLEMKYNESHFVSPYERKSLAEKLGITERAVIYWFQNRRRKDIKNLNNMGQPPPLCRDS